jgi:diguanylate cyclase (GGDEF)-like protein
MILIVKGLQHPNRTSKGFLQMIISRTTQKAGRVLLVISEPDIIRVLEVNLAHANLDVISAQSGSEALRKLESNEPDIIILDATLPDISHAEMRRRINEISTANRVPVIVIGTRLERNNPIPKIEDSIIHVITKPFEPKEVVALVQGYLIHKERMINTNPLTGLPNRIQISNEIHRLLQQKSNLAMILIALHDLPAINKAYGYHQGDQIIRVLGNIISEAVHLFGNSTDLSGHFSGDKFAVITSPWKARTLCRRIIADYNRRIRLLFADEHLSAGYAGYRNTPDIKEQTPNMSIHIAVVTNEKRTYIHPLEVIEAASEQIELLKTLPESNCYFDLKGNRVVPSVIVSHRETTQAYKEGLRAMQGAMGWLDFITRELELPMNRMKDSLQTFERNSENLDKIHQQSIKNLHDNYHLLARIVGGISSLTKSETPGSGTSEEVDIRDVLVWVLKQVEVLATQHQISADIITDGEIYRIVRDKKSLAQSLLYIIRSEIISSPLASRLRIHLSDKSEEYIRVKISNPDHYISTLILDNLLHQQSSTLEGTSINELFPANILIQSLGGKLEATGEKGKGTTYVVTLPKKWQSWMQEIDTLHLAMDISRKEAREALETTRQTIASPDKQKPHDIRYNFDKLCSKIQELAVLCNRSLFLADDCNTRLEIQQDRLLQHDVEQSAASEAILTICRDTAATFQMKHLFSPESAKDVADCSLAIAKEFRMSESDCQALYYAALFKDLALAFVRHNSDERYSINIEIMADASERLNLVWKALSTVPFFSTACKLILYRWETYNGTGGNFGIKGADIPLGSRILAVVDTYYRLTSDQSTHVKLTPSSAMRKIVENSGLCFDPKIVSAFLMIYKWKDIELALADN